MSVPIAFILRGHDNDSYMLQGCANLTRCHVCGELLQRPKLVDSFRLRKKLDVSATYDGYMIVSQRFVDEWQRIGGDGLEFRPLPEESGYFVIDTFQEVEFDTERRRANASKFIKS